MPPSSSCASRGVLTCTMPTLEAPGQMRARFGPGVGEQHRSQRFVAGAWERQERGRLCLPERGAGCVRVTAEALEAARLAVPPIGGNAPERDLAGDQRGDLRGVV